jgi:predicted transcriptional regulator
MSVTLKSPKIQSLASLREELTAVVRGERPAPSDAARMRFNTIGALYRLLTPENRQLLAVIRDRKPASIAALAKMTGRAEPNLIRTLGKLEAGGFVGFEVRGRSKAPRVNPSKIVVEIDPCAQRDKMKVA